MREREPKNALSTKMQWRYFRRLLSNWREDFEGQPSDGGTPGSGVSRNATTIGASQSTRSIMPT
jgi:hypothetical protein